jgi:hypothetical protein
MLKGADRLIKEGRVVGFSLELWDFAPTPAWPCSWQVFKYLDSMGYEPVLKTQRTARCWAGDFIFMKKG